ncbi:BBSome-interacting protein 1 [Plasmodiophora brassicae]|uniref:BBSome-interacting protein 1 n=1 Tax=Plasmodiophora brassicae TaxID=37360 RepID=A0A3P3YFI1_PLABS|nr:unnamed protein product [Plasmodiophora brassicae]
MDNDDVEQTTAAGETERPEVVLPRTGLLFSEKGNLTEVLCKPKIMSIKSITLEKLEKMERDAANAAPGGSTQRQ